MSSNDHSSGASKILLAFFSGIAAGIAAGFYLNSEHGRHFRQDTMEKLSSFESKIEDKVKSAFKNAKETAKQTAASVEDKAQKFQKEADRTNV